MQHCMPQIHVWPGIYLSIPWIYMRPNNNNNNNNNNKGSMGMGDVVPL